MFRWLLKLIFGTKPQPTIIQGLTAHQIYELLQFAGYNPEEVLNTADLGIQALDRDGNNNLREAEEGRAQAETEYAEKLAELNRGLQIARNGYAAKTESAQAMLDKARKLKGILNHATPSTGME
jgi:hypothetical protein